MPAESHYDITRSFIAFDHLTCMLSVTSDGQHRYSNPCTVTQLIEV